MCIGGIMNKDPVHRALNRVDPIRKELNKVDPLRKYLNKPETKSSTPKPTDVPQLATATSDTESTLLTGSNTATQRKTILGQ